MRIAPLIPLAVLAGGIFAALAAQRFIEASAGGERKPRLDLSDMQVHSLELHQRTSFMAREATFEGDSIDAREVSGRMDTGDAPLDFDARSMRMQSGAMLLEGDVVLRGERSTLRSQRVEVEEDGSLRGAPAALSDRDHDASFSARGFVIDAAGNLRLEGDVRGVFEQ